MPPDHPGLCCVMGEWQVAPERDADEQLAEQQALLDRWTLDLRRDR